MNFYRREFSSRLLIGSALYPSPAIMQGAIRASGAEIVTVALRREAAGRQDATHGLSDGSILSTIWVPISSE
jgi:thiazole synthase ThiGH ThiG subunit